MNILLPHNKKNLSLIFLFTLALAHGMENKSLQSSGSVKINMSEKPGTIKQWMFVSRMLSWEQCSRMMDAMGDGLLDMTPLDWAKKCLVEIHKKSSSEGKQLLKTIKEKALDDLDEPWLKAIEEIRLQEILQTKIKIKNS